MSVARENELFTEEEYLVRESSAEYKSEFVAGRIYAMAGASRNHCTLTTNSIVAIHAALTNKPCQVFSNDMKVRVGAMEKSARAYYYPDLVVSCKNEEDPYYVSHPKLIIEVSSPSTKRTDHREKLFAYMQISSLEEYAVIEQDERKITFYRRSNDFYGEECFPDDVPIFESIGLKVDFETLYRGVVREEKE